MEQRLARPVEHKHGLRRVLACFALSAGLAASTISPARADSATADALFREGRKAADAGDHATAAARFAESQRLDPAPGTLLNLALAEEKLSRFASALDHVSGVIDGLPKGDARLGLARSLRARLEAKVPRVRIRLASDAPPGTVVRRDEVELGRAALGLDLPLDPGPHTIHVTAEGREPATFTVDAKEGIHATIDIAPGPPTPPPKGDTGTPLPEPAAPAPPTASTTASAASPPLAPPSEAPRASRTGIAFVVGGSAALVASGIMGALVLRKKSVVEEHCPAKRCDPEGLAAGDAGRSLSFGSTLAFGVGAVATGVGVFLLVRKGEEPSRTAATLRLGPGQLSLGGHF